MFGIFIIIAVCSLLSRVMVHGSDVHSPTGWINIYGYNDDFCTSAANTGFITYACGFCTTVKNGVYYKLTCSETNNKITYKYANYTAAGCNDADLVFTKTSILNSSTCLVRTTQYGNAVESDDFDTGYYSNAKYTYTSGSNPPSLPYSGYLKKTYNDSTCSSAGLIELKLFNQPYCYYVNVSETAKFNCDGTVTFYGNSVCANPVVFTYPAASESNKCLVDTSDDSNGFSFYYSCYSKKSSSKSKCFSMMETVQLESGEIKNMKDIAIGDRVMMMNKQDLTTVYPSPVISLPHGKDNQEISTFIHIITNTDRDIKMSEEHLVVGGKCDKTPLELIQANELMIGDCVLTVTGAETIVSLKKEVNHGIITIVTMSNDLLIVNGIIASPFAINHQVANAFYTIHRIFHSVFPYLTSSTLLVKSFEQFGDLVTSLFV